MMSGLRAFEQAFPLGFCYALRINVSPCTEGMRTQYLSTFKGFKDFAFWEPAK